MEEFFKFTYRRGKPVRDYGKIVLLDKKRKWDGLAEGWDYIIVNPTLLELERCIIITDAEFVLVDDIPSTYKIYGDPCLDTDKGEISFTVTRTVEYQGKVISSQVDYTKNFTFGLTGGEEFYNLLPTEAQQRVDDFRVYMTWIRQNDLVVLSHYEDFPARRGFRLRSDTESLKVETSGRGSQEYPKEVSVIKLQSLVYQPVFQEGFEPAEPETLKEVTKRLKTLSLEESGLPFSFRPVWKSPNMMVGVMTVNGDEIEGLVKRQGDGTGSYLDAVMYMGLAELPPSTLSDDHIMWLERGGKVIWVYEIVGFINSMKPVSGCPSDPSDSWIKVVDAYGGICYVQDPSFQNLDYEKLVEMSRNRSLFSGFQKKISSLLCLPTEMPFYQWGVTEFGKVAERRLEELKAEMIEGLTLENSVQRIETARTKAEELKAELRAQYDNAHALITGVEAEVEKALDEIGEEFVYLETVNEINNHINQAKEALKKADFVEVGHHCREAEVLMPNLDDYYDDEDFDEPEVAQEESSEEDMKAALLRLQRSGNFRIK